MSAIDCSACTDLKTYAPEFSINGVTDNVAASLKNNTGFNPALTVLHENCEDLNDANDCLIGRMGDEIKAYDNCDWKEFMGKFIPNLYEMLKADIMSQCGTITRIENLCDAVQGLYQALRGVPRPSEYIFLTPSDTFRQKVKSTHATDDAYPSLVMGKANVTMCDTSGAIQGFYFTVSGKNSAAGWQGFQVVEALSVGDVLGYLDMSQVVPKYFTESVFRVWANGAVIHPWATLNADTVPTLLISLQDDGRAELRIRGFVGSSRTGGLWNALPFVNIF